VTELERTRDAPAASPAVSVVIAAYNAAATLPETLASLARQTFTDWEAVVVDDGSTDDTAAVAERLAAGDPRIRVLRQANAGHSAARNAAIAAARGDWIVCLDSDDWVDSRYFEVMTGAAGANPMLDAIVCGGVRVAPSGEHGTPATYEPSSVANLFWGLAVDCPIAIHNCMVRRSLVVDVGGFDTSLRACADWDFWQKIARTGAHFGAVPDVLAFYRTRPGSVSGNAERALVDGWAVIRRGHARDSRVPSPDPRFAHGAAAAGLAPALYRQAVWAASIMLARGEDARVLVPLMGDERAPSLAPETVAGWLYEYIPFACSRCTEDWPELWSRAGDLVERYLEALETQSRTEGLARQSKHALRMLMGQAADDAPRRSAKAARRPWDGIIERMRSFVRGE
jgi:glycosyltransferase involved in cell wall biosynthesis